MKFKNLVALLIPMLFSCSVEPQAIDYGSSQCHFCKMTIVDSQHASEIVTVKGKSYMYDAIECMLNDLQNRNQTEIKLYLVADYQNPGNLIDVSEAHFLICDAIPSPMGAYLSAFSDQNKRDELSDNNEGDNFGWHQIKAKFLN
jgi:copper chaperone NosL